MSEIPYSPEEVDEIMHNLLLEKKRVQELEIELEKFQKDPSYTGEQIQKFKQLIGVLRKKYEEAQHRSAELQKRIEQFLVEQEQQKTVQFSFIEEQKQKDLRIRELITELKEAQNKQQETAQNLKDSEEELTALRGQLIQLREHLQNGSDGCSKQELENAKQKISQLERVIQFLRVRAEEAHLENQDLNREMGKANSLASELNGKLEETINSYEKKGIELCDQLTVAKEELEFTKQVMEKALQDATEEAKKSSHDYEKKIRELENEFSALKDKLKNVESERDHAQQIAEAKMSEEIELLKQKQKDQLKELESLKIAFVKKQEELDHFQNENAQLSKKLSEIEDQKNKAENLQEETESRLKVAQQHLAKKVRETTLLSEKNEEYRVQQLELQSGLDAAKAKIIELQSNLEMEGQHQKRLQEQYQEGLKSFEAQALKWEEKYFQMQEKWQEAETQIREFKRVEERHAKLQQVLNHLGNLLGTPLSLPISPLDLPHLFDQAQAEVDKSLTEKEPPQQLLFETPNTPKRYRETLFE